MKNLCCFLICVLYQSFCISEEYQKIYVGKDQIFIEEYGFEIHLDDTVVFVQEIFATRRL